MKKLLALVMVLGMVSVASAALTLSYSEGMLSVDIAPGDSLIGIDAQIRIAEGDAVLGAATGFAQFTGANTAIAPVAGFPGRYSGGAITMFGGGPIVGPKAVISGMSIGEWDLGTADNYDVKVELYNYAGGTVLNGQTVGAGVIDTLYLVPEPITMTLLGLGGLVALRRRMA